jgi:hypothetical protein
MEWSALTRSTPSTAIVRSVPDPLPGTRARYAGAHACFGSPLEPMLVELRRDTVPVSDGVSTEEANVCFTARLGGTGH